MTAAPDYFEPLVGWRLWLVAETEMGMRLRSVFHKTEWPPCQAARAACLARRRPWLIHPFGRRPARHSAPDPGCTCGLHAARPEWLLGHMANQRGRHVIGRVLLWGEVVECEYGWRATCAYPAHLYVPRVTAVEDPVTEKIVAGLEVYRVPVEHTSEDVALELLAAA